jgi:hypothetical protein
MQFELKETTYDAYIEKKFGNDGRSRGIFTDLKKSRRAAAHFAKNEIPSLLIARENK